MQIDYASDVSGRLVLYLSASIANAAANLRLRDHLPAPGFELVLPQEFTPRDRGHPEYPRAIYERCLAEMERCDAALLLLDAFGVDCASEAGWLCARGKPLIGVTGTATRFAQHWMVKGNLTAVVGFDPVVHDVVRGDPILGSLEPRLLAGWPALGPAIRDIVSGHHGRAQRVAAGGQRT